MMIKNNFFGTILVGLLIAILLMASVQMLGFGGGIQEIAKPEDINADLPKVKTIAKVESVDASEGNLMDVINKRPVFSEDRKPYPVPLEVIEPQDPPDVIEELKAKLTAVVITPEKKYAMIHDNVTNEKLTYKEGMPLEGEQGGWSLAEIHERKVVMISEDNKTVDLELEIFAPKGGGAAMNVRGQQQSNQATEDKELQEKMEKKKTADEIRKKIAERRAQMRAEALKKQ